MPDLFHRDLLVVIDFGDNLKLGYVFMGASKKDALQYLVEHKIGEAMETITFTELEKTLWGTKYTELLSDGVKTVGVYSLGNLLPHEDTHDK